MSWLPVSPVVGIKADRLLRGVGLAVAAGALLAVLGPFGSYLNAGAGRLAAYWIGAMLLGLVLYGAAYGAVGRVVPHRARLWWPALIGAALVASLPQAVATRLAAFWLWPQLAHVDLPPALWFAQTALIGLTSTAGVAIVLRRSRPAATHARLQALPRTEPALGRDVLALQMEDHYVRVHRPGGSELILMPLGRAIACVRADGLQTHRSWWVARAAVVAVEGDARAMRLVLSNGSVAPVSRSSVARLKAAGWLG